MSLHGHDPPWFHSAHPPLRTWPCDGILCAIGNGGGPALDGFVRVPEGHPWRRFTDYRDIPVVVHGGLTHGPRPPRRGPARPPAVAGSPPAATWHDTLGWIGFSTDHAGDLWSDAELTASGIVRHEAFDELRRLQRMSHQAAPEGLRTTWTLARLIAGIEQLAGQVADASW
jgi:hypothetical protein